jgi:hypothetical protein
MIILQISQLSIRRKLYSFLLCSIMKCFSEICNFYSRTNSVWRLNFLINVPVRVLCLHFIELYPSITFINWEKHIFMLIMFN